MKFYPSDWRADPALRMCSLGARGLWAELMCIMHEAEPYGFLLINGKVPTTKQIASLVGASERETERHLAELDAGGVFSRNDDAVIYSRRMTRDYAKSETDRKNGKGGGNPILLKGVNPPDNGGDKAQKPDTRNQIPEEKKDIRAVAKATRPAPNPDFEKFKEAYPKRGAANPWQPARKLFEAAIKNGENVENIIKSAGAYRAECDRTKTVGTDKVAQAQTWLRQERWKDYLESADGQQPSEENETKMAAKGWFWIDGKWQQTKPDIALFPEPKSAPVPAQRLLRLKSI